MIRLQRNPRTIPLRSGDKNKFWSDAHACYHLCLRLPLALFSASRGFLLLFLSPQRFPQRDLTNDASWCSWLLTTMTPLASGMRGHASRRPLEITEPLSPSEGLLDFNGEAYASHRDTSSMLGKWLRFPSLGPNSLIRCTQPGNLAITWNVHV